MKNSESIKIQYNIVIAMSESEEAIPIENSMLYRLRDIAISGKFL